MPNVNAIIEQQLDGIAAEIENVKAAFDSTPYESMTQTRQLSNTNTKAYRPFTVPDGELWLVTGLSVTTTPSGVAAGTECAVFVEHTTQNEVALKTTTPVPGFRHWIAVQRLPIYLYPLYSIEVRANQSPGAFIKWETTIVYAKTTIPKTIPGD
jgi:hypothetical protein